MPETKKQYNARKAAGMRKMKARQTHAAQLVGFNSITDVVNLIIENAGDPDGLTLNYGEVKDVETKVYQLRGEKRTRA